MLIPSRLRLVVSIALTAYCAVARAQLAETATTPAELQTALQRCLDSGPDGDTIEGSGNLGDFRKWCGLRNLTVRGGTITGGTACNPAGVTFEGVTFAGAFAATAEPSGNAGDITFRACTFRGGLVCQGQGADARPLGTVLMDRCLTVDSSTGMAVARPRFIGSRWVRAGDGAGQHAVYLYSAQVAGPAAFEGCEFVTARGENAIDARMGATIVGSSFVNCSLAVAGTANLSLDHCVISGIVPLWSGYGGCGIFADGKGGTLAIGRTIVEVGSGAAEGVYIYGQWNSASVVDCRFLGLASAHPDSRGIRLSRINGPFSLTFNTIEMHRGRVVIDDSMHAWTGAGSRLFSGNPADNQAELPGGRVSLETFNAATGGSSILAPGGLPAFGIDEWLRSEGYAGTDFVPEYERRVIAGPTGYADWVRARLGF